MPVRILTVMGRSTCAAMPATILANLVGFFSSAAPRPLLVASAVRSGKQSQCGEEMSLGNAGGWVGGGGEGVEEGGGCNVP
jgi:hypothetical protein